ncbi:MAG: hypothetical protein Q8K58_10865 [Acidimicrobiales bacterium]|nr:hypothetical protein [Acidimicrobiales bacterium]
MSGTLAALVALSVVSLTSCAESRTSTVEERVSTSTVATTTSTPPAAAGLPRGWLGSRAAVEEHFVAKWGVQKVRCFWEIIDADSLVWCYVDLPAGHQRLSVGTVELFPDGTWREIPVPDSPTRYDEPDESEVHDGRQGYEDPEWSEHDDTEWSEYDDPEWSEYDEEVPYDTSDPMEYDYVEEYPEPPMDEGEEYPDP